jgi:hypothetical protein
MKTSSSLSSMLCSKCAQLCACSLVQIQARRLLFIYNTTRLASLRDCVGIRRVQEHRQKSRVAVSKQARPGSATA